MLCLRCKICIVWIFLRFSWSRHSDVIVFTFSLSLHFHYFIMIFSVLVSQLYLDHSLKSRIFFSFFILVSLIPVHFNIISVNTQSNFIAV